MIQINVEYLTRTKKWHVTVEVNAGFEFSAFDTKKEALQHVINWAKRLGDETVSLAVTGAEPPHLTGGSPQ